MAAASSSAATVSLSEFLSRMGGSPDKTDNSSRRAREVQSASVLIVDSFDRRLTEGSRFAALRGAAGGGGGGGGGAGGGACRSFFSSYEDVALLGLLV